MSASELLNWIVRVAFVLITLFAVVDLLRWRDRTRLDIVLMFSALAVPILWGEIQRAAHLDAPWTSLVGTLVLVAQPYLLLRLVQHFQPVPRLIHAIGLLGMLLAWTLMLALPAPLPPAALLVIVAYFAFVEAYCAVGYVRGALEAGGVRRWRLMFAAGGSAWLALLILLAGLAVTRLAAAGVIAPLAQLLALLAAVSYYIGFAPPRLLRRAWQLAELYRYLREASQRPVEERVAGALQQLCAASTRAAGGLASVVWLWDEDSQTLAVSASDAPGAPPAELTTGADAVQQVWQERRPRLIHSPAPGKRELLAVPLAAPDRAWGVLAVLLGQRALFPDDDLALLALLAEQAAGTLAAAERFQQQRSLVAQLQAANQELDAFSYSVSHDLRAPLRAMDGFSRLLLERHAEALPAEAQHYLRRIRENAQGMGQLVDDLLTFARLGRQPLKLQRARTAEIARQAWDDLRSLHQGRQVELALDDLPDCRADPVLLRQVFVNLLDNALKYSRPRAPARITVGHLNHDSEPTFFVQDNGVGFDMAYAGKLFGVFQRLHRAEDYEGTGVGLAIVERIIRRHGGRVRAEAAPDQGATFFFTLQGVKP